MPKKLSLFRHPPRNPLRKRKFSYMPDQWIVDGRYGSETSATIGTAPSACRHRRGGHPTKIGNRRAGQIFAAVANARAAKGRIIRKLKPLADARGSVTIPASASTRKNRAMESLCPFPQNSINARGDQA